MQGVMLYITLGYAFIKKKTFDINIKVRQIFSITGYFGLFWVALIIDNNINVILENPLFKGNGYLCS